MSPFRGLRETLGLAARDGIRCDEGRAERYRLEAKHGSSWMNALDAHAAEGHGGLRERRECYRQAEQIVYASDSELLILVHDISDQARTWKWSMHVEWWPDVASYHDRLDALALIGTGRADERPADGHRDRQTEERAQAPVSTGAGL